MPVLAGQLSLASRVFMIKRGFDFILRKDVDPIHDA